MRNAKLSGSKDPRSASPPKEPGGEERCFPGVRLPQKICHRVPEVCWGSDTVLQLGDEPKQALDCAKTLTLACLFTEPPDRTLWPDPFGRGPSDIRGPFGAPPAKGFPGEVDGGPFGGPDPLDKSPGQWLTIE